MCCLSYGMSKWIGILVSWRRRINFKPHFLRPASSRRPWVRLGVLFPLMPVSLTEEHHLKKKKQKKKHKNCLKLEKPQITFSGIYGSSLMTNDVYFTISKHFLPKPASEATEIGW